MENHLLDDELLHQEEGSKSLTDLINFGYETDAIGYIQRGFSIFTSDIGSFIGFGIVYVLIALAISFVMSFLPIVNMLTSAVIAPLMMGAYIVANKIYKGERYSFSNFFDGYKDFGEIAVATLIKLGIIILVLLVCLIPFGIKMIANFRNLDAITENPAALISTFILPLSLMIIVFLVVYTFWMFGLFFIVFPKFKAWQSLEASRKVISKKFFNWVGFGLLLFLINLLGMLPLGIGLFISIPTSVCAMYYAFEDVCGVNIRP